MISKAVVVKVLRETAGGTESCFADIDFEEKNNEVELEDENAEEISEYVKNDIDFSSPIMLEAKGIMTEDGDSVSVTYQTNLDDMLPCCITYSFGKKHPEALTLRTYRIGESIDFFIKGRLQLFSEEERTARGIVSRFTSNLKNHITYESGGYMELEYFDEVDGEITAHCKELLVVEPSAAKNQEVAQ